MLHKYPQPQKSVNKICADFEIEICFVKVVKDLVHYHVHIKWWLSTWGREFSKSVKKVGLSQFGAYKLAKIRGVLNSQPISIMY